MSWVGCRPRPPLAHKHTGGTQQRTAESDVPLAAADDLGALLDGVLDGRLDDVDLSGHRHGAAVAGGALLHLGDELADALHKLVIDRLMHV